MAGSVGCGVGWRHKIRLPVTRKPRPRTASGRSFKKHTRARSRAVKSNVGGAANPSNPGAQTPLDSQRAEHRHAAYQRSRPDRLLDLALPIRHFSAADRAGRHFHFLSPSEEQLPELELPPWRTLRSDRPDPVTQVAPASRDFASRPGAPAAPAAPPLVSISTASPESGSFPPDTNGSVGNDQYVETVNTRYQVWSLNRATNTATSILGPVNINTLWAGFGGACQTQNAGDPVVLYDKVANRWLISQFTSAADGAVSSISAWLSPRRPTPPGPMPATRSPCPERATFGDYPHYGVWTDAYYVMAHNFDPDGPGGFTFVAGLLRRHGPHQNARGRPVRHLAGHPRSLGRRPHARRPGWIRSASGRRSGHLHLAACGRDVPLSDEGGFRHAGKHYPNAASDHAHRPGQRRLWRR